MVETIGSAKQDVGGLTFISGEITDALCYARNRQRSIQCFLYLRQTVDMEAHSSRFAWPDISTMVQCQGNNFADLRLQVTPVPGNCVTMFQEVDSCNKLRART